MKVASGPKQIQWDSINVYTKIAKIDSGLKFNFIRYKIKQINESTNLNILLRTNKI